MKEIKHKVTVHTKLEFYKKHLSIINPLLPVQMTSKELEIMACFLEIENDSRYDRFGPQAKKVVREYAKISHSGMSNYIKNLVAKGFLKKNEVGVLTIIPILMPKTLEQNYSIKLSYEEPKH